MIRFLFSPLRRKRFYADINGCLNGVYVAGDAVIDAWSSLRAEATLRRIIAVIDPDYKGVVITLEYAGYDSANEIRRRYRKSTG